MKYFFTIASIFLLSIWSCHAAHINQELFDALDSLPQSYKTTSIRTSLEKNQPTEALKTALNHSVGTDLPLVTLLLDHNIGLNLGYFNPLEYAIDWHASLDVIYLLIKRGLKINAVDCYSKHNALTTASHTYRIFSEVQDGAYLLMLHGSIIQLEAWLCLSWDKGIMEAALNGDDKLLKKTLPYEHPTLDQLREMRKKFGRQLTWALGLAIGRNKPSMVEYLLNYADPYASFWPKSLTQLTPLILIQNILERTDLTDIERLGYEQVQSKVARTIALHLCSIYSRILLNMQRMYGLRDEALIAIIRQMLHEYSPLLAQQILQAFFIEQSREEARIFTKERLEMLTQEAYQPGTFFQAFPKFAHAVGQDPREEATYDERFNRLRDAIRLHNLGWVKQLTPLLTIPLDRIPLQTSAMKELLNEAHLAYARSEKTPARRKAQCILDIITSASAQQAADEPTTSDDMRELKYIEKRPLVAATQARRRILTLEEVGQL